jgi:type I restriction enzyme S subunit
MIEVKAGYKQTEVGVIPEDWEVISYGEAFDFLSTASYSRADLSDNDEVFYVHYGDIHTTWSHFLDFKKYTLPTIEKIKVKIYSFMKNGDLIMADASEDYGGIGKSVEVKNITTNKAISGLHTFLLRGKEGIFVDGFKGYIHSNQLVKTSMDRLATGLKVYGVSKTNLKTIQIPRPTLPEQSAIATVLSDTDALIERLEKLIAKKKNIKQGAMQQLLTGKKRLLGFEIKKGYKQTELGIIPEDWKVKKLGGECELITKGTTPTSVGRDFQKSGINFIKIESLEKNGEIIKDKVAFIDSFTYNLLKRSQLKSKDILFSIAGALGRVAIVSDEILPANTNQALAIVRLNKTKALNINYLFHFLNSEKIQRHIESISVQGAQANLSLLNIYDLPVAYPKYQEQHAIATILYDMDTEIESLEQTRDKYTMIKQGMMQQLLTGRIRIHGTN